MNNLFYFRLARTNLMKNKSIYFPYIITCICTIAAFYIMSAIGNNKGLNEMPGSDSLVLILRMGIIIIGIFSCIFLFYTNSFLIKRRKKELGLYGILGLEKKHVSKIMAIEALDICVLTLAAGLALGLILSKFIFLVLLNLMDFDVTLQFAISWPSIKYTLILFPCIFIATLLFNLWQIRVVSPIELLHGGNIGEREPKTKWIMTFIGFLFLGIGYSIAIMVESPLEALSLFFVAVFCVMIGTYALFTAGSIAVLKLLRKRKTFYYKTNNFISISGMIYRMKQNAVGLSNICILSTMVLVVISTTVCLYVGRKDLLRNRFPYDTKIAYMEEADKTTVIETQLKKAREKHPIQVKNVFYYSYFSIIGKREQDNIILTQEENRYQEGISIIECISLEDYNRLEKKEIALKKNEILILSSKAPFHSQTIQLGEKKYRIKENLKHFVLEEKNNSIGVETIYLILPSKEEIVQLGSLLEKEETGKIFFTHEYQFNMGGEKDECIAFVKELRELLRKNARAVRALRVENIMEEEQGFYSIYGGFLFLGIFLGLLFMMATVLIIYYKQISEGYEDHERFVIMQKVGLSKKEVFQVIKKQILFIFFLPLMGAVIHILFAFKVISQLLFVFNLRNVTLFMVCTGVTIVLFVVLYGMVYHFTAKTYYKLVQM